MRAQNRARAHAHTARQMRITADTREVDRLAKHLANFARRGLPYAIKDALNKTAFAARRHWQDEIRESFTLRNKYTERSIRVDRARGLNVRSLQATVGSTADYMATQETGGVERGKAGRKGIPGPSAAGLPPGADRTKLVRKRFWRGAIKLAHNPEPRGNRSRRNWVAMLQAKRRGDKAVLLERSNGGKGIFRVMGTKRKPKVRLLWSFKGSVSVPPEPTMRRAVTRTDKDFDAIAKRSLIEQLKRHHVIA